MLNICSASESARLVEANKIDGRKFDSKLDVFCEGAYSF